MQPDARPELFDLACPDQGRRIRPVARLDGLLDDDRARAARQRCEFVHGFFGTK
jgi:hypothetical protein